MHHLIFVLVLVAGGPGIVGSTTVRIGGYDSYTQCTKQAAALSNDEWHGFCVPANYL